MQWCKTSYLCCRGLPICLHASVVDSGKRGGMRTWAELFWTLRSEPLPPTLLGQQRPALLRTPRARCNTSNVTAPAPVQYQHVPAHCLPEAVASPATNEETIYKYIQLGYSAVRSQLFGPLQKTKRDNSRAQMGMVCLVSPRPAFRQDSLPVIATGLRRRVPFCARDGGCLRRSPLRGPGSFYDPSLSARRLFRHFRPFAGMCRNRDQQQHGARNSASTITELG